MLEHTYTAKHIDEALKFARRDLGPDAVLLSSKPADPSRFPDHKDRIEVRFASFPKNPMGRGKKDTTPLLDLSTSGHLTHALERRGVPFAIAESLAAHMQKPGGAAPRSLAQGQHDLAKALERRLPPKKPKPNGSAPRVIALVGPTGVGKTTTLAKLAARAALIDGHSVGLICVDHYRIGGIEQLQRYADLIGIPMEVARDADSLKRAVHRLQNASHIFIDTEGRSPRDSKAIEAMAARLYNAHPQTETLLCFPASANHAEVHNLLERHAPLRPCGLICTKVDEALSFGSLITAPSLGQIPLLYLATGQRVPEDLETATPKRTAELICHGDLN